MGVCSIYSLWGNNSDIVLFDRSLEFVIMVWLDIACLWSALFDIDKAISKILKGNTEKD